MTQSSRKIIDKKLRKKIDAQLYSLLTNNSNNKIFEPLMKEILSNDEQLMLAKRVAIIAMLCRGHSGYRIEKVLNVSPQTIMNLRNRIKNNDLKILEGIFGKMPRGKKKFVKERGILEELDNILSLGGVLPPYVGHGGMKRAYSRT